MEGGKKVMFKSLLTVTLMVSSIQNEKIHVNNVICIANYEYVLLLGIMSDAIIPCLRTRATAISRLFFILILTTDK